MHYLPRGHGGLKTKGFKVIRSKSNSIAFYWSLGMRNQVETQKERSQETSIQSNEPTHFLFRGEGAGSYTKYL